MELVSATPLQLAGPAPAVISAGRPQQRWEQGVVLADEVLCARELAQKGNNAISIGTRIRNAILSLATAVQQSFDG